MIKLCTLALAACLAASAQVQQYPVSSGGGGGTTSLTVEQNGTSQGTATVLNCTNLACSVASGTATISISTPTIDAQNNGSDLGQVFALNCGTNTTCTNASGVVTITSTGGGSGSGATYVTSNPSGGACTTGTGLEVWSTDPNGPSEWTCPSGTWTKTPALPTLSLVGNHICVAYASGADTPSTCDSIIRTVTTTSDTITLGDAVGVVNYNDASAVAVSVVAPNPSIPATTEFQIVNYGAGALTLTPQGGNWQPAGTSTFVVAGGTSSSPSYLSFYTDGTNLFPKLYIPSGSGGGGGSVTASSIQSALTPLTGCSTAGNTYLPQSNTCVAPSGGSTVAAAAPYLQIGSNYYLTNDSMFQATRPNGLVGWATLPSSTGTGTITNQANESTTITNSTGSVAWYEAPSAAKTSIELVANWNTTPGDDTDSGGGGIWFYDSANSKLYVFKASYDTTYESITIDNQTWVYNGVSNPSFSGNGTQSVSPLFGHIHLKGVVSGTSLTFSWSDDGGASWISETPITVGTIGGNGIAAQWGTLDVFSISAS